ncbi:MAG: TetR/AcrR family transcriptional regulator, regulator of autoinduction and epiphytic fitness [Thermoleophilaceae bacterium]|nr:TetR/AcrR family transcriptional regulator, regulator of autoinduction and epiphytic fitness [Thermoleophilaceae bacterium]
MGSATPPNAPDGTTLDGRNARADRTHRALTDAMLELLDEGDLKPTAERIAGRAGVSERTLFQHFPDREALFQGAALAQAERIAPLVEPLPATSAPVEERVRAFVAQRARLLERVTPVRRAALLMEPTSETIAGWLAAVRQGAAAEVDEVFAPELEGRGDRAELLASLVAAAAWPTWESLRAHQGLSPERAEAALSRTISALLGCF